MRKHLLAVLVGVVSVGSFATLGCGQKKINECNALIGIINNGVQSLDKKGKIAGDSSGVAEMKSMADAMDKVASDAAKIELSIPELKKYSTDYQAMAKDVAKAARDMAAAAEAKDANKINAAQAAMDKSVKAEDPLVESINKFCQAP